MIASSSQGGPGVPNQASFKNLGVLPRKLTWNPKNGGWMKDVFPSLFSKRVIFRFHVKFRSCISETIVKNLLLAMIPVKKSQGFKMLV